MSYQQGQPPQWPQQQPPYGQPQRPPQQPVGQSQWGQQVPPQAYGQPQQSQYGYAPPQQPQWSPQQFQQQPPMYPQPPMMPQPQRRSKRKLWVILGIVVVVVFFACIGSALATRSNNTGTVVQNSQSSSSSNPQTNPTTVVQHFKVGQVVKVGDTWDVTMNSAKISQGQSFDKPKSGTVFLLIDVSLKNISSSEQAVSSLMMFTLRDSTGQEYTESITTFTKPPDGKVEAGAPLRGTLAYEVPSTQHQFTFAFVSSITSSGQSIWDVKV